MTIALARVDDRLIHGQVMTSWLSFTRATKIIVIDDVTANDPFLSMIIKTSVPANIATVITTLEKSFEFVNEINDEERVILLAKTPKPYVFLVEKGIQLKKINIGGMGIKTGRKTLYRNISASDEEINQMKKLIDAGIIVEIQMVVEDPVIDIKKLI
jgi:PTS system mannose-specific IIB component